MIKLVFCLHRRPELSREEFQNYWSTKHAPLVASHADTLRIRRYVQVHTGDEAINDALRASRRGPQSYDGVAELWWDSIDDLVGGASTPEGAAAARELLEDERTFIDLERSPLWIGEEHEVVAAR